MENQYRQNRHYFSITTYLVGCKYNASSLEQKILVAHEIGHVLGAQHNNNQIGGQYTIMTNQSFLEDDVDLEFHSTSVSQINPYAHSYT